jgi:FixJ family two-component response regulator
VGVVDDDESQPKSPPQLLRSAGMQPIAYAYAEELRTDAKQSRFDHLAGKGIATLVIFVTAYDDPKAREAESNGPITAPRLRNSRVPSLKRPNRNVIRSSK